MAILRRPPPSSSSSSASGGTRPSPRRLPTLPLLATLLPLCLSLPSPPLVAAFAPPDDPTDTRFALGGSPSTGESGPGCPPWTFRDAKSGIPLEHRDGSCDRKYENDPVRNEGLRRHLQMSVQSGHMRRLRDERTWICPDDGELAEVAGEELITGPATVWLFRNEATTPVSVSWLVPGRDDGAEVSAFRPTSGLPAHLDPDSVLRPGEWRALDVYMGHTFHVRELIPDGGGGTPTPGRILLRHRPGPIALRNRHGGPRADCPVHALSDPDPHGRVPDPHAPDPEEERRRLEEERERYRRTSFGYNNLCNSLHRVFVNRASCPLDVSYAGTVEETDLPSRVVPVENGGDEDLIANSTNALPLATRGGCTERFKFHLGVNAAQTNDYDVKWDSPVAFESTYLSHRFVARLHHDPTVLVDEVIVDRTVIRDCPREKKRARAGAGIREGVREEVGQSEIDMAGNVIKGYDDPSPLGCVECSKNTTAPVASHPNATIVEGMTSGGGGTDDGGNHARSAKVKSEDQ